MIRCISLWRLTETGNEAVSYYYVANVAYGTWMPEDRGENYKLEVGTGENGGIDIEHRKVKSIMNRKNVFSMERLQLYFPVMIRNGRLC